MLTQEHEEFHAKWEAECRARDARSEYGRTAADARRFLKRARLCLLFVQTGAQYSSTCMLLTASALREALAHLKDEAGLPCEFDPEDRKLVIGGWRAIEKLGPKQ